MRYFFVIIENHTREVGSFRTEELPNFPAALDALDAHLLAEYRGRHVVGILRRRRSENNEKMLDTQPIF